MDEQKKAGMGGRIARIVKLAELAQEQLDAGNPVGVELFADLIEEQAETLGKEALDARVK